MVSNWGLYYATAPSDLLIDLGGTQPTPPPPGSYPWRPFSSTTSPWNVRIDWGNATQSGLGRTPAELFGATGHAWVNDEQAGAYIFHEDANSINWSVFDQRNNRTLALRAPSNFGPANSATDFNTQLFTSAGVAWDFYQLTTSSPGTGSCAGAASTALNGTGVGTFGSTVKVGFRAAGFPWSAGCITLDDWNNRIIPHALVVALAGNDLQNGFLYPATAQDAGGYAAGGALPQGALMGIPPSKTKPSGMSTIGSMVWDAARDYGIYVGDRTGGWVFVADYGPQKRVTPAIIDPLRYSPFDGDRVVAALVRVTGGKPSIPHHN
jgi:hypothetical protein